MKKLITILIILLIFPIAFAEDNYNQYTNLRLNFNIEGEFNLTKTRASGSVSEANAFLTFFPTNDDLQKVNSISYHSNPEARTTKSSEDIKYNWVRPEIRRLTFGLDSTVNVNNALVVIDKKIEFPIQEQTSFFLNPTEFIDITPEIREKAEEIVTNEEDLYVATHKVGYWIQQNIRYNLSTLTTDAVQKSSWVLEEREGVCDEITNLFISMMRSMGVPARFVSGMAYTNLERTWGPHGWAEVYFPNKGWVPFDVTYGQFGWIDPTHIKLKTSADSGEAAIRYSWRARDITIEDKKIELKTTLINVGEPISSPINFEIKPLIDNVGPGSFVPIEIEATNTNNYYFPETFTVVKATNLTEKNHKPLLLKPKETKKLFWITRIPEEVDQGFIYRSLIEIEDQFKTTRKTNITYSDQRQTITLEQAKDLIREHYPDTEERLESNELGVVCTAPRTKFSYEDINIDCIIRNKGNKILNNLETCYLNDCTIFGLGPTESENIMFTIKLDEGFHNVIINSRNHAVEASDIITIEVLKTPELNISNIEYPETVDYNETFNLSLTFTAKTPVHNLIVKINNQEVSAISNLDSTQQITIQTTGKDIYSREGIKINLEYRDFNEKTYFVEEVYPLEVSNVPWYIKFLKFLRLV